MSTDPARHRLDGDQGSRPLIQVTRGHPTPQDIAALSAVVTAILARRTRAAAETEARRHSPTRPGWPNRTAQLRVPLVTGPGAWRRSTRPH